MIDRVFVALWLQISTTAIGHADRPNILFVRPDGSPPKLPPASSKEPTLNRAAIFDRKDSNGDGILTLDEYLDRFPDEDEGRRRFPNFDKGQDGQLSRDEFVNPKR